MYDLNNDNINVSLSSENSNNPNEDRLNFKQLNFIRNGYYLAVYDGHGGDFVSNYANERFPLYFEENYLTIEKKEFKQYEYEYDTNLIKKQREVIIEAIKKTFSQIERELYLITEKEFETGNQNAAFVGSCALVIIIHNNEIISANLGDSKAMLFRKSTNSTSTNIEKIKIINYVNNNFSDYNVILKSELNNNLFFKLIIIFKNSLLLNFKYLNDLTCSDNLNLYTKNERRFSLFYIFQNISKTTKLIITRNIK